jgi:predicted ester cyclase
MPTPQDVIASLYRAFNTRNFDAYAQFLTPDFQLRAKGRGSVRGVEACQAFDREWVRAFPDGHITMEKQVADASSVMGECRFVGTHTGALRGAAGEVPGHGKEGRDHLHGRLRVPGRQDHVRACVLRPTGAVAAVGSEASAGTRVRRGGVAAPKDASTHCASRAVVSAALRNRSALLEFLLCHGFSRHWHYRSVRLWLVA